jgi:hypothetical protein
MSPVTPDKIRTLQRKLYCKTKAEPAFRFYVLYDKICREDILRHAYGLARANAGAPGVDGVSFEQIEERGLEAWLAGLREELVSKTYRPDPVRRVMIPKLTLIVAPHALHIPWLLVWPAPSLQPECAYVPVHECEPLEEKRATAQDESARAAGAWQQ